MPYVRFLLRVGPGQTPVEPFRGVGIKILLSRFWVFQFGAVNVTGHFESL